VANKFVWSGATGANDGSSWADAYTSLMRDWGAEGSFTPATDFIYVRSVHSETSSSTLTMTGSVADTTAPCRVICCVGATTGTSPGNLATGADVNTDNVAGHVVLDNGLYVYGVEFYSKNEIFLGEDPTDQDIVLEDCRLELTGTATDYINIGDVSSSDAQKVVWKNVTIDFAINGQGIWVRHVTFSWIGGTCERDADTLLRVPAQGSKGNILLSGLDLSTLTSSALCSGSASVNADRLIVFSRCLLATGATILNASIKEPGYRVEAYHCQIGTDADPAYQMAVEDARGLIITDTARYRTGGASDGERTNPISWDMDTASAGTLRGYPGHALESPPIAAWTDGDGTTSHTYRIYFASDATLQDDELWIEVELPNDAATNPKASIVTNRVAPLSSAANHPTDGGSTWTGTGVGTKQYMEVSHTPDKPGPVLARIFMAKASDHVYIDPQIVIDP
jgi:hypothetical protein